MFKIHPNPREPIAKGILVKRSCVDGVLMVTLKPTGVKLFHSDVKRETRINRIQLETRRLLGAFNCNLPSTSVHNEITYCKYVMRLPDFDSQ